MNTIKSYIYLNNPQNLNRVNEPVMTKLMFHEFEVEENLIQLFDESGQEVAYQLIDKIYGSDNRLIEATMVYLVSMKSGELAKRYTLMLNDQETCSVNFEGIKDLKVEQSDGFRRLDTGYYILELCEGTADGTSYGKWGIRYFKSKEEDFNLIKDYSNAIGGFYGPFFTPKNGLVNPPEHTIAEISVEEEGPLYHRYIFEGKIPNGLDPNLRDKSFRITWEFFYGTPWFRRKYDVDEFSTTVDQSPVVNKITVGDEFESGQGNRVFDRFATYGKTIFRAGDPYASILYDGVYKLLNEATDESNPKIKTYRDSIGADDLNDVSWDYFWRLFATEANILSEGEIKEHVEDIIPEAHDVVYHTDRYNNVQVSEDSVDVNIVPEQTIFAMNANKTAHINDTSGYKMVWYTSNVVSNYQIVQRNDSGWVNWGTNGENEYPELPVGSTIYTAYGQFDRWEDIADAMEKNIYSKQGKFESL